MMLYQKNFGNSVPMQMYQDISLNKKKKSFKYSAIGLWHGLHWMPNSIFPKFYFTSENMHEISMNSISSLVKAGDSNVYNTFFKNKIIVIGNFKDDVEPTPIGTMPATLLLVNSFYTLQNKYDVYSLWCLFFLFVCFTLVSYYVFNHEKLQKRFTTKKYSPAVRHFFKKNRLFISLLIISIISDLCFDIRSTVLLLMLYFYLLEHSRNIFLFIKKTFV